MRTYLCHECGGYFIWRHMMALTETRQGARWDVCVNCCALYNLWRKVWLADVMVNYGMR